MPLIRPFAGLRPVPQYAAEVLAPPYDVLSSAEARVRAEGHPWSFLHISKAEIDLAEDINPHDPAVYRKAAENLDRMIRESILVRDQQPCYYVYRLTRGEHVQTGLVAVASVTDYISNRIRRHEFTRPDKEDDRVRQIDALNAQTGPVLMAYKSQPEMNNMLEEVTHDRPEVGVMADDGIEHTIWVVRDAAVADRISEGFDAMESLYIADGHHRSAAAARVARDRHAATAAVSAGEAMSGYFLTVIFPHDQMLILDYNRVIRDLNGMSAETFLARITEDFSVRAAAQAVHPQCPAEFGMYLGGQWYRLNVTAPVPDAPVARLDVGLLDDLLIAPVLGITDPRRDPRIDFVGGIRGLEALEARVDSGEMQVAFSLFPTGMEDLIAVADAGKVMPPKSTWFEPKLADGLVSHILD